MKKYTLKNAERMYSFYGKSPFLYKLSNYLVFFSKEKYLRKKAVENLNLKKGDKVLDLACGIGNNFDYLLKKIGSNGIIVGIDYSQNMLNTAKKIIDRKGISNIRLLKKDAAKLRLSHCYFDGIISTNGISSIPNYKEGLRRSISSLKKGKRIVILDGKLFDGHYKILNCFLKLFRWPVGWRSDIDILHYTKKLLRHVTLTEFLGGSFYIVIGIKE